MELNDLRKLSGLNECGMSPMPSTPPSPASISMTAASGSELSGMLKDIMSLAGMHKVEPAHLGVEPPPMKLLPEPVKAVGPAASDGEVMRGITDKLNLGKDDDEKKADESWDNEPASPQPEEAFDANQYAHHENPPGAAKGRNFKNNPVANVEDVAEQLFADYQSFLAENVFEDEGDLRGSVLDILKQIYAGADSGQDMIDVLADELGDYFDQVEMSGDETLQNAYMLMRNQGMEAEGNPKLMAQVAKKAIDLLSDELPEEKSWFDMTSAERQAHYYKKGGGRPQPGHSAAPAKTAKGDIMRTAKDVKAHTKGKQDEH